MPKPKPRRPSPPVGVDLRSLTNEQLREKERRYTDNSRTSLDLLCLGEPKTRSERNNQDRILHEMRICAEAFRPSLVNPPLTNAYFRECLAPASKAAEALRSKLSHCPARDYLDALLAESRISLSETEKNLTAFCDALAQEIVRLNHAEDSERRGKGSGRRARPMFRELVHSFGELFEREYRGDSSKVRSRNPFGKVSPSRHELERNKFVEHALRSHGIYCPADIERYFRPPPPKKR